MSVIVGTRCLLLLDGVSVEIWLSSSREWMIDFGTFWHRWSTSSATNYLQQLKGDV